ncbi:hypothetical protein GUITHDRAFT_63361 [Guillardia theta CCMP2712]|uniref:AAA+ ATPase domain-containing protein n=1 Tax=Guillardia theta (strain CCMP2712) TaxID=905079 RepID=L1K227_GUITC|nr:hypothetical protein GUITHDRAFT_63361 [Guillardia theta CCMP2712]EKX54505.1 hypothetical protein GUITHDRAFT_63361 [Guillardia theta CCMP2712]|eukprot:XP_005841485.1 hypothetical protein GUITHDRAFT_63361 [Guillardia theta CCMP2712]
MPLKFWFSSVGHSVAFRFGFQNEQNLNMLFLGAAGTGKTSMARAVAKILRHMGILEKGHLVEVCRKDLVAEYSGQSAARTAAKVKEALGGVLFIDEAYSLKHEEGKDSFGQEVVDTLVSEMENNRKRLVVIMAGYTREMADFMRSNSGLESRFPLSFEFPNYSYSEMAQIFRVMARARKLHVAVEEEKLVELITSCIPRSVASKGNARFVRNLLEIACMRQAERLLKLPKRTREQVEEVAERSRRLEEEGKEGAGREGWGRLTLLQLMTLEGEDFSAFTEKEFEGGKPFPSYPPLRMHLSS